MGRLVYLDSLRGLAVILVIVQHLCAGIIRQGYIDSAWWTANILISLSTPAVPLFIIISGGLLLTDQRDIPVVDFLIRRFNKVGVPFLFWMIFYYFWFLLGIWHDDFHLVEFIKEILKGSDTKHLPIHLWFLPLILSLYLITPLLKKFLASSNESEKKYVIIMCFIFGCITPIMHDLSNIEVGYRPYIYSIDVLYFSLGFFILRIEDNKKINTALTAAIYIIGLSFTIYGIFFLQETNGKFNNIWYTMNSPAVLFMSICIVLLFKKYYYDNISSKISKFLPYIGKMSFGVYVIHIFWMQLLSIKFGINVNLFHPVISVPILTLIVLILSLISIHIIQIVPYGKLILPE